MQVDAYGYLSNLSYFVEKGEFNSIPDAQGNVWIADGDIYGYGPDAKEKQTIHTPERPSTMTIINDTLYFTGRKALYRTVINH